MVVLLTVKVVAKMEGVGVKVGGKIVGASLWSIVWIVVIQELSCIGVHMMGILGESLL